MVCPATRFPLTAAEVPPVANWMRMAGVTAVGVGGTGVGGTTEVGVDVGGTGVGGAEVSVTTAGVGGRLVLVG